MRTSQAGECEVEPRSRAGTAGLGGAAQANFPPAAFVIGAQKAATTSLASLLSQHPGLGVSKPKEPHFFTANFDRGLDWYRQCFARDASCLLDASTSYTMAPLAENPAAIASPVVIGVPRRIYEARPDAKFIYVVRDPAARAFSAYWHNVREGREDRPLRQAVTEDRSYSDPSFYFAQLTKYMEFFDIGRFLIIRFDDFIRNPLHEAGRCAEFLRLEAFRFEPEPAKNESFQYNAFGTWARNQAGTAWLERISVAVRDVTPAWSHGALRRLMQKPNPRLSADDHVWLSSFFQKDEEDFRKLTGIAVTEAAMETYRASVSDE